MEQEYKYMVCTSCMTYNQSAYIVDALNGFSMQKTSFPVINIIADDASTDGERDVIRQYLSVYFHEPYRIEETDDYHLICANHITNPNCIFVVFLLKYNHYSIKKRKLPYMEEWLNNTKYIASCEGDDYWIDPLKLQKQVSFMENNPDYGMVTTASKIHEQGIGMRSGYFGHAYRGIEDLLEGNYIFYATILNRKSLEDRYMKEVGNQKDWKMGDWPRILHCAIVSKIGFIDEPTSVYRIFPNSASHFDSFDMFKAFNENSVAVAKYFIKNYHLDVNRLHPLLDNWLNKRLLLKACSVGDVGLVNQYKHRVVGLSVKEKMMVFISSYAVTMKLYGFYRRIRKAAIRNKH